MRGRIAAFAFSWLGVTAVSAALALSPAPEKARGESMSANLRRHLLAMPYDSATGRRPFTKADTLARDYVSGRFAAWGLEPALDDGARLQGFPVMRGARLGPESGVVVSAGDSSWALERGKDFVPIESSGDGDFSGGVAFIGYGIRDPLSGYDDYSKVDLAGKTVVCFVVPPRHVDAAIRKKAFALPYMRKAAILDSLGARAVLYAMPASFPSCNTLSEPSFKDAARFRELRDPAAIPVLRMTHDALGRMMRSAGIDLEALERTLETTTTSNALVLPGVELSMKIALERETADVFNVLGLLPGRDTARTIVIGAHYDGPAYDDNASGVAVMLELARLCAERGPFDCNLLFAAFGFEEGGLVGSRYLVDHLPRRAGAIKAMLNFDVIGRIKADTLVAGNVQPDGEWERLSAGIDTRGLVVVPAPWTGGSDSFSFIRAGVPAFWFFEGAKENVHRPDALASINLDGMERALLFAYDFLRRIDDPSIELRPPDKSKKAFTSWPSHAPDSLQRESEKAR